ncbi:MAG: pyruvate ferredoxin oxidoreductase [Coriobacteriia bacterium]|nr:pyruvate ferredoxin oxidoreductase [Coriobacteriia bacterium]MCL2537205.1 pyruvate ferredoxin oxidoreductase [Coriobacteriia bacterium]
MTHIKYTEQTTIAATGNTFVTEAFRQVEPDALCAYPITPQTTIVEKFAQLVADGDVATEYVCTESEHSAMTATIGAAAAGGRAYTATSAQGLAHMWEELYIASGLRLPIVMANVNRALSAPINIHGDHSDIMGARDTGWVMILAESPQEAYDNTIISTPVSEDLLLPVMSCLDGFITSHSIMRGDVAADATVKEFVGEYSPRDSLMFGEPRTVGPFANLGPTYMKVKKAQRDAMDRGLEVIKRVGDQWAEITGRSYDHVECWGMEDAERAIVVMGSAAGNARAVARSLREGGEKVGVVKIRTYRPFPLADVGAALAHVKAVAVLDRAETFSTLAGPLAKDTIAALFNAGVTVPVRNYIYGLGGNDVKLEQMYQVFDDLTKVDGDGIATSVNMTPRYLGIGPCSYEL